LDIFFTPYWIDTNADFATVFPVFTALVHPVPFLGKGGTVNGEQNRVLFTPLFTGKHLYIQQLASVAFTPFGRSERGEQKWLFVHPLVNA
jgi:hypothetical protein